MIKKLIKKKAVVSKKVVVKKKVVTGANLFRPLILSRHPSHNILRAKNKHMPLMSTRAVVRFGSTTEVADTVAKGGRRIEVNTTSAIRNSANKLLMKQCFAKAKVKTAQWFQGKNEAGTLQACGDMEYPVVAKAHFGSRGQGNTLIKSEEELRRWMRGKTLSNYIFEKFHNYSNEFRLHITEDGCFYTCRKALKRDVPEDQKWHFHDDTCVWFLETNENFNRPNSWNDIVNDCVKALKAVGADMLSFDVKVQAPQDGKGRRREYQDYILLECNSASSMDNGTGGVSVCASKYIEEIPKVIRRKANESLRTR